MAAQPTPLEWSRLEYVAGIAHDLKTPLATIATSADLLEKDFDPVDLWPSDRNHSASSPQTADNDPRLVRVSNVGVRNGGAPSGFGEPDRSSA